MDLKKISLEDDKKNLNHQKHFFVFYKACPQRAWPLAVTAPLPLTLPFPVKYRCQVTHSSLFLSSHVRKEKKLYVSLRHFLLILNLLIL